MAGAGCRGGREDWGVWGIELDAQREISESQGGHAESKSSLLEIVIQRGQTQLLPPRQIPVSNIVGCQPVVAGECDCRLPDPERLSPLHLNREPPQCLREVGDTFLGNPLSAFRNSESVGNLKWPHGKHNRVGLFECCEHGAAARGGLVREAPTQRQRGMHHERDTTNGGIGSVLVPFVD